MFGDVRNSIYSYLIGTHFTILTDHKALEVIYSAKSKVPAKVENWALRLQQYDFEIFHRKGDGNPADVLSRKPLPTTSLVATCSRSMDQFNENHTAPRTI